MTNTIWYKGKCSRCSKEHPELTIKVYKDRGDSVMSEEFWCFDCLKNEVHKENE